MYLNHECPICDKIYERNCTPEPDLPCPECEKIRAIKVFYDGLKFNRLWTIGWTERKEYVLSKWIFDFCYWKKHVWQIRILRVFITSYNKNSVRLVKE